MQNKNTVSPSVILLLKEALSVIYWRKEDLEQFVKFTVSNTSIISTINWTLNKRQSVKELLNKIMSRRDIYESDLLNLISAVSNFNDFENLKYWDENGSKLKKAKEAVDNLRKHCKDFIHTTNEEEESVKRKIRSDQKTKAALSLGDELMDLKNKFNEIAINKNFQQRGFQFEKFLYELFLIFELEPKGSFKIFGEQIDGAFTFHNTDYLLEAKWATQVNRSDIAAFCYKVETKFKNTAGLLISIDGVTKEAISPDFKSIIIMDDVDILAILDHRISLPDLLFKKRRKASETGNIYLNFIDLIK
jgi:hypothetical protein